MNKIVWGTRRLSDFVGTADPTNRPYPFGGNAFGITVVLYLGFVYYTLGRPSVMQ